jgi:hypothetical protein
MLEVTLAGDGDGDEGGGEGGGEAAPLLLPLGLVELVDAPVECAASFPEAPRAGQPAAVSLRLTNASAHFQALEVTCAAASLEEARAARAESRFELADRFSRYVVELLPRASKQLSFAVVAHAPGPALLPIVTVRAAPPREQQQQQQQQAQAQAQTQQQGAAAAAAALAQAAVMAVVPSVAGATVFVSP